MHAARDGDVGMVKAGMPVNIGDKDDWAALIRAAIKNRTDIVRFLLEKVANVNGKTPIDLARGRNYQEVVGLLQQY